MAAVYTLGNHVLGVVQTIRNYVLGQSTAGDTDSWPVFVADQDVTVESVRWVPAADVTGADTNNFALQLVNKGTDGTGTDGVTTVKTYASGTDSTADVPETLTLHGTAANLDVDEGEVVSLVRTVNGTGLAQPDGVVEVTYQAKATDRG